MVLVVLYDYLEEQYFVGIIWTACFELTPAEQCKFYNLQFSSAVAALALIIMAYYSYNLPLTGNHLKLDIIMDELQLQLRDADQSLDQIEQDDLMRVSALARSLVQIQSESELNYEQFLHLEVRIDENRGTILKCNLAITQYIINIHTNQQQLKQLEQTTKHIRKIKWLESVRQALSTFKKVLTIREVQLTMILFVLQFRDKQNFKELYCKNFGEIMQFMIEESQCHKKINIYILDDLFKKELEYLRVYLETIGSLKSYNDYLMEDNLEEQAEQEVDNIVSRMKIANSKIKTISEVFPFACVKDTDDLFSVSLLHQRWQKLIGMERIVYISLSDSLTLQKSFKDIKENLNVINAAMSIMDRYKGQNKGINQKIKDVYDNSIRILKCALFKKQAKFQAEIMISQGKDDLAKEIWNLPESKKFREFIALCLPSIAHSGVYYLPRVFKQYFYSKMNMQKVELPQFNIEDKIRYRQQLMVKKKYEQSIRVRINYSKKLQYKHQKEKQNSSFFNKVTKIFKSQEKAPKAVIFHIHGGGFIAMSSFIHQTYTRNWSNHLNVPIISVDYGKAPDRPFPDGLYDCFQAYMWTIQAFANVFQVMPQKVILVGDSAGGNLVAALTSLLVKWELKKPSGIVLAYPALNLNLSTYTPSFLTALNDMILPHTFLKVCAKSYLGKYTDEADKNTFISPLVAQDQILSKFPTTEIFVGNKDPFHDDCCRFIERLSELNDKNNRLTIFEEFPHGFLQFDLKLMPNQFSRQATKLVQKALQKLINTP